MKKIDTIYNGTRIEFDEVNEEWRAYLNEFHGNGDDEVNDYFKCNTSLKKLKESIDRFQRRNFTPIPVFVKDYTYNFEPAEIISFTDSPGECWIRKNNGIKERISTTGKRGQESSLYACENRNNESKILDLFKVEEELKKLKLDLQIKNKEKIQIIDTMQSFDITGFVTNDIC